MSTSPLSRSRRAKTPGPPPRHCCAISTAARRRTASASVPTPAAACPASMRDGRVCGMDVGHSGALLETLHELLVQRPAAGSRAAGLHQQRGRLLRLPGKGRIEVGADADLVVLDARTAARHRGAGRDRSCPGGRAGAPWYVRALIEARSSTHVPSKVPDGERAAGSFRSAAPRTRKATAASSSASWSCAAAGRRASRDSDGQPAGRYRASATRICSTRDRRSPRHVDRFRHTPRLPTSRGRLQRLEHATGVFFTGGNQLRISTMLGGTPVPS